MTTSTTTESSLVVRTESSETSSTLDEGAWTELIDNHSASTPFHTLAWRRTVDRTFDYTARYRIVYRSGEPVACLPGFDVSNLPFLPTETTNPFCEYGFPIVESDVPPRDVLRVLAAESGRRDTIVIKDGQWSGVRGYATARFGGTAVGIAPRLDIGGGFEAVERQFDGEVRRNCNRAYEAGLSVTESRDVGVYYHLYLRTMRRLGSPQLPQSFFDTLLHEFGEDARIWLVTDGSGPVAGVLALGYNGYWVVWSSASLESAWRHHPNDLAYTAAVRTLCEETATVVDFGRTEPESGVATFKSRFGGVDALLVSFTAPVHRSSGSVSMLKRLQPAARACSSVITHPWVGPRLKAIIHE